jgi:hypothetical protein
LLNDLANLSDLDSNIFPVDSPILSTFDNTIINLSECPNITILEICCGININLDIIATSLPSLKTLVFLHTKNWSGSLRELTRLQNLSFHGFSGSILNDCSELIRSLPFNSAQTLTHLELDFPNVADDPAFNTEPLDSFLHLTSLMIGPLCPNICDFVIRSRICLTMFGASIIRNFLPIEKFRDMLGAQCLRHLKMLELSNWYDDCDSEDVVDPEEYYHYLLHIFDAFTSILSFVEEVELNGVSWHLQCCRFFARMGNLKILRWFGSSLLGFEDSLLGFEDETVEEDEMVAIVEHALNEAFSNFAKKPKIELGAPLVQRGVWF